MADRLKHQNAGLKYFDQIIKEALDYLVLSPSSHMEKAPFNCNSAELNLCLLKKVLTNTLNINSIKTDQTSTFMVVTNESIQEMTR